jgi:hypothetical protein
MIDITNGMFRIRNGGSALFASDVDFNDDAVVNVSGFADWTFSNQPIFNGGFRAYSPIIFEDAPSFVDGLIITTGQLIQYSTPQSWVVRFPFVLGSQRNTLSSAFDFTVTGLFRQIDNTTWPLRLWTYPQGLWGKTPFNITAAEFRVRAENLTGSPIGDTEFNIFVLDEDWVQDGASLTAIDAAPNSASDHSATWSGTAKAVDPSSQIFGISFYGYAGGDTLNSTTKWYEIKTVRLTLQASARGLY